MDHELEVEVFRAGDYGPRGAYTEQDLEQIAGDYAPSVHEAPVTIDHRQEGPAMGWVRALRRAGSVLVARLSGLDPEFLQKLRAGAFKKRSIELYRAAEWSSRPYLRSVTFLGACPPAVKGLADPVFSEDSPQPWIEFEDASEALLSAADEPADTALEKPLAGEERCAETLEPSFADPSDGSPAVAPLAVDEQASQFCERLRAEGRLLPAWEERGVGRFLSALDNAALVAFSDTPEAEEQTLRAWFEGFLSALAPSVPLGEAAAQEPLRPGGLPTAPAGFGDRYGSRVDPESLALHRRVLRFLEANPAASYTDALHSVAAVR